jgi:hypothetical protein
MPSITIAPEKHRKAPAMSAVSTPVGTIAKGQNGNYWMIVPTQVSQRWVEMGSKKPTVYQTETNGSSLRVVVADTRMYIFTVESVKWVYTTPPYRRFWTSKGTWMVPPRKKPAPLAPKHTTVLVEIGVNTYLWIDGHSIARFTTTEPILDYDAPMGNSFMPYPFALTSSYAYLLAEEKRIEWPSGTQGNPYDIYYSSKAINTTKINWKLLVDLWKFTKST